MKHAFHLVLLLLTLFFWKGFADSGAEIELLKESLSEVKRMGDPKNEIGSIENEIQGAEARRIFMGLLLTIGTCVVGGIFVWAYLLPFIAQRATLAVFEGGDVVEQDDPMRDAHAFMAQGEYEKAVDAFRKVAADDPSIRMPWVEMAKVHRTHLEDPDSAIAVLREGLEAHAWEEDDAAFLLFRLSEIYHEDLDDRATCRALMQQVIDTFPETRHSANATHKLHEWDREDEEKDLMDRLHGKDADGNPLG